MRRLGASSRPAGARAPPRRGCRHGERRDRRRAGRFAAAAQGARRRSRSWPSTSRPTRSASPGRTRSATRSPIGSRSRRPTCCPDGDGGFDLVARQPAVRPARRDGRPAAGGLVRAGDRARRRRGRAGGHRAPARPAARQRWRADGVALLEIGADQGEAIVALVAATLPGWRAPSSPTWPGCRVSRGSPARPRSPRPKRLEPAVGHHQRRARHQDTRTDPAHPPDRPRHRRDARRR